MAILKRKDETKTKTLSVRIDGALHAEVERLRKDAEAVNLVFDVAEVVEKALASAVRVARSELDSSQQGSAAGAAA